MKLNGYQIVGESLSNNIYYHGSPIQNLTSLEPRKKSFRFKTDSPRVFASPDITYASAFTFAWNNSDNIELGSINNGPWIIKIPIAFKKIVTTQPCSIYIVKGNFKQIKSMSVEYVSNDIVKILKEIKYPSALKAMIDNRLKVEWI